MLGHVMLSGENVSMMVIVYALVNAVVSVITVNRLATTLHTEILLAGKKNLELFDCTKEFYCTKVTSNFNSGNLLFLQLRKISFSYTLNN